MEFEQGIDSQAEFYKNLAHFSFRQANEEKRFHQLENALVAHAQLPIQQLEHLAILFNRANIDEFGWESFLSLLSQQNSLSSQVLAGFAENVLRVASAEPCDVNWLQLEGLVSQLAKVEQGNLRDPLLFESIRLFVSAGLDEQRSQLLYRQAEAYSRKGNCTDIRRIFEGAYYLRNLAVDQLDQFIRSGKSHADFVAEKLMIQDLALRVEEVELIEEALGLHGKHSNGAEVILLPFSPPAQTILRSLKPLAPGERLRSLQAVKELLSLGAEVQELSPAIHQLSLVYRAREWDFAIGLQALKRFHPIRVLRDDALKVAVRLADQGFPLELLSSHRSRLMQVEQLDGELSLDRVLRSRPRAEDFRNLGISDDILAESCAELLRNCRRESLSSIPEFLTEIEELKCCYHRHISLTPETEKEEFCQHLVKVFLENPNRNDAEFWQAFQRSMEQGYEQYGLQLLRFWSSVPDLDLNLKPFIETYRSLSIPEHFLPVPRVASYERYLRQLPEIEDIFRDQLAFLESVDPPLSSLQKLISSIVSFKSELPDELDDAERRQFFADFLFMYLRLEQGSAEVIDIRHSLFHELCSNSLALPQALPSLHEIVEREREHAAQGEGKLESLTLARLKELHDELEFKRRPHLAHDALKTVLFSQDELQVKLAKDWLRTRYYLDSVPFDLESEDEIVRARAKKMYQECHRVLRNAFDHSYSFSSAQFFARRIPQGDDSLLVRFAKDSGALVKPLAAQSNEIFPGRGFVMSGLDLSRILVEDREDSEQPYWVYKEAWPWASKAIDHFEHSQFIFTRGLMAIIAPDSEDYCIDGQHYSYLAFNEHFENEQRVVAFLVPTDFLKRKFSAKNKGQSFDLCDIGLSAEELLRSSAEEGVSVLDVGAATNLSGLGNAFPPNRAPYFEWEQTVRAEVRDRFGHVHKAFSLGRLARRQSDELEQKLEIFRQLHDQVHEPLKNYQNLEHFRRIAFMLYKKGQTGRPHNQSLEAEQAAKPEFEELGDFSGQSQAALPPMLAEIHDWNEAVRDGRIAEHDAPVLAIIPTFRQSSLPREGALIDSATMRMSAIDGSWEEVLDLDLDHSRALQLWYEHYGPYLASSEHDFVLLHRDEFLRDSKASIQEE